MEREAGRRLGEGVVETKGERRGMANTVAREADFGFLTRGSAVSFLTSTVAMATGEGKFWLGEGM